MGGTQSFELMKLAACEKNKRNSERLLDVSACSQHPFQQPELIKHHRDRLVDLSASGQHYFQQQKLIKRHRDCLLDLDC